MSEWSDVNRPVSVVEMARAFDTTTARLERLLRRHAIRPACRVGRVRLYGPEQVQRLYALLGS